MFFEIFLDPTTQKFLNNFASGEFRELAEAPYEIIKILFFNLLLEKLFFVD